MGDVWQWELIMPTVMFLNYFAFSSYLPSALTVLLLFASIKVCESKHNLLISYFKTQTVLRVYLSSYLVFPKLLQWSMARQQYFSRDGFAMAEQVYLAWSPLIHVVNGHFRQGTLINTCCGANGFVFLTFSAYSEGEPVYLYFQVNILYWKTIKKTFKTSLISLCHCLYHLLECDLPPWCGDSKRCNLGALLPPQLMFFLTLR